MISLNAHRFLRVLLSLAVGLLACISGAQAPLKVATRVIPPFVIQDKERLTGFSVDLWKELTDKMGVKSSFVVKPTIVDLLAAVKSHEADAGIAAISITEERDKDFDFSQPMFDAGLQIMVPKKSENQSEIRSIWNQLLAAGIFRWLAFIFIVGLIPAHVVWLFERDPAKGLLKNPKYFPGIFEAYWWSLACLATQAEEMPRTALGRVVAVFWMFSAVVFVAFFTAQITASLTVQQLRGTINGPGDLPGKRVATTTGSTAAAYLHEQGVTVLDFPQIDQAYDALGKGDVDAVVFDSPSLQYFCTHDGKGRFDTVGDVFKKESSNKYI